MHVSVSACLIVKSDAARLERAVASIRPYVDEVCIVDTGSTDGTAETAKHLADKFESFTGCNFEDGEIADFSAARARSFAMASHDCAIWLDSDDVLTGGEHIQEAIAWCQAQANGQPWRACFGYEYDRDESGQCNNWQMRERIVYPRSAFRWVYRVHEGLTAIQSDEWQTVEPPQPVVWRHDIDKRKPRSRRNLRILRDHVSKVGVDNVDLKTVFDLGQEYAKAGDHVLAVAWLGRYVIQSDLTDERLLSCLTAVDVLSFWPGREEDASKWAQMAIDIDPDAPDGYFALAKLAYGRAAKEKSLERRHLQRAVYFARKGLERPARQRRTSLNPLDVVANIPSILQDALTRLGDHAGALAAMRLVAAGRPDDVEVQLRLRECEQKAASRGAKSLDVAIVCGITVESWDPTTPDKRGIGGSETAVIEMAKRLAARGCRVRVFCRVETPGLYDGVEYRSMGESDQAAGCDLLIAWRNATLLETTPARVKWLWVHDTAIAGANPWNLSLADRVLALSQWHARHLAQTYPSVAGKTTVTRNGVELTRFESTDLARYPHKAVYSSSPDRGLEQLLEMWPNIRARVPDAELHVFYGWSSFSAEYQRSMSSKAEAAGGVVLRGRVDQKTLANEMMSAGAWLYPSWCGDRAFTETSCISAMEAQAAGLSVVASAYGALEETVATGKTLHYVSNDADSADMFERAAVEALTSTHAGTRAAMRRYAREHFSWDGVADQWIPLMRYDVAAAPRVSPVRSDGRLPTLHMILAPQASGDIVIDAASPGHEPHGGGSRAGFMGLTAAVAARGDVRVTAFSTFKEVRISRDGVDYVRLDHLSSHPKPDVVLAYYDTSPLGSYGPGVLRIASHHTYSPYMHFDSADVNTAPSEHAIAFLRDRYDPTGAWSVLPNAVGQMSVERRPVAGRVIYHTSPDRGLDVLLNVWPMVRAAVPHATLHVVGGVREILDGKDVPGRLGEQSRRIRAAWDEASTVGGVELLGRLPRATLDAELGEASVFAFPCAPVAPCETFSVSIMECCKIGLPVVLAPADSLESIYAGHVRMTPSPVRVHECEFAEALIDVLTSDREQGRLAAAGKDLARQFTFDRAADALYSIIREHLPIRPKTVQVRYRTEGEAISAYAE